ncbi:MAG TPA: hypothetical protein VM370_11740 [Candidatus Thermoplasmatota archaeon]|nr:hypothetical protein [Candidatus Thermoplasmatota archaeon]
MDDEDEVERLKVKVALDMLDHVARSDGELATPGSAVARVRRDVLRGLNGRPSTSRSESK